MEEGDWRLSNPRFTDEAIEQNLKFVEVIDSIAEAHGATKAQIALAWVLGQNDEITTIPGTRNPSRLEENFGVFQVQLTEEDLQSIETHLPSHTAGERY